MGWEPVLRSLHTVFILGLFLVPLRLVQALCQANAKMQLEVQEIFWGKGLSGKREGWGLDGEAGSSNTCEGEEG